jgi:hypothetical protein
MAVKAAPIKSHCINGTRCLVLVFVCACVRVCLVCDYINIGLWAVELLKVYYYHHLLPCFVFCFYVLCFPFLHRITGCYKPSSEPYRIYFSFLTLADSVSGLWAVTFAGKKRELNYYYYYYYYY